MELFKGKVVCPRCNGNGLVYKIIYRKIELYICDECEATWENGKLISIETFKDLQVILEQKGIKYSEIFNLVEDYEWYKSS